MMVVVMEQPVNEKMQNYQIKKQTKGNGSSYIT